jgi:hypothetical protein
MSDEILRRLDEIQDDLKEIKSEVKATNGRVRTLEMWRYGLDQIKSLRSWRWPAFVGVVSGVTVTILGGLVAVAINAFWG